MHTYSKRSSGGCGAPMRGAASFSLVEVVIAIGVATFVLVSIFGLMAYAAQSVQQADKYARLSTVASQELALVGSQAYASTPCGHYAVSGGNHGAYYNETNYYTYKGLPTNSASAYYRSVVADATPTPLANYPFTVAGQQVMEPLQIIIWWPSPGYANSNIIVTSVLNYKSL